MRDLGELPDGFPVLAGSVGPSHGFVHVRDVGATVTVFGMQVAQGDLIHADRHGAVCIPLDVIPLLNAAIDRLFAAEAVVLDPVKGGTVDFETFKNLWAEFERART
jgi:regulator of RNase E activity RraA